MSDSALVAIGLTLTIAVAFLIAKWAGPTSREIEARCEHRGGVAQLSASPARRDFLIVVCKDGSLRPVRP